MLGRLMAIGVLIIASFTLLASLPDLLRYLKIRKMSAGRERSSASA